MPTSTVDVATTDTGVSASGLELTFSTALDDVENLEQLGPIIKQITESGQQDAFLDKLNTLIRKKDGEIERICNQHYEEFIDAVDQLMEIRKDASNLKDNIVGVNTKLQRQGKTLVEKKRELLQARKMQQNIDEAIEALQTSLSVLEMSNKVGQDVEPSKYYTTLKTLESLETNHLRDVSQYGFAKLLAESIPVTQQRIQDTVTIELKEWLANIRKVSRDIGSLAMRRMQERQERWRTKTAENPKLKALQHHHVNSAIEMVINEGVEQSILDDIQIDFEPLYRCIHVYDVLGKRNAFKASYEEDRRAQANLALSGPVNLKNGNISTFETLLQDIVGFFIVEHVILHSTREIRSQSEVDALWEMVTSKVIDVVSESLKGCRDRDLFLKVKFLLQLFIQTLEGFDFAVKPLQETLIALFRRYSELLITQYSDEFEKIVEQDECMPMTVSNMKELQDIQHYTQFQPDPDLLKRYGFPLRLPFSEVFPTCCRDVQELVREFYQFAVGFAQKHGEMDDIIRQAVDNLLIDKVNGILIKKLQSTNLSQIVQIIINIGYFASMCPTFETLLKDARSFHWTGEIHLKATSTFKETQRKAEKRVFEVVNSKLDEFLDLFEIDWESTEIQTQPNSSLQDLATFLINVTNAALLNLPETIKSQIYQDALVHLNQSLKQLLLDPDHPIVTDVALRNFDADVRYLEKFMQSLGDSSILDTFTELRQLMNLALSESPEDILQTSVRSKLYSRVNSTDVIVLFEKLLRVPTPTQKTTRRRQMENVARVLRSVYSNSGR